MRVKLKLRCPVCTHARLELVEREGAYVELRCTRCGIGYRVALTYVKRKYIRNNLLDWVQLLRDLYEGLYLNVVLTGLRRIQRSGESSNILKHIR